MCASEGGSFVRRQRGQGDLNGRCGLSGALALSLLAAAGLAHGQCEPAWVPAPVGPFLSNAAQSKVSEGPTRACIACGSSKPAPSTRNCLAR
jgi:hypothetical protein